MKMAGVLDLVRTTTRTRVAGLVAECFRTQNQRNGVLDVAFRGNSCTNFPTNFFGAVLIGNDNDTSSAFTDTCVDFAASNSYSNTNEIGRAHV